MKYALVPQLAGILKQATLKDTQRKKVGGKNILYICYHSIQGAKTLKYALLPQLAGILKHATLKDTLRRGGKKRKSTRANV